MKTVVITGSARGLGLEMTKVFRKNNFNVVLSDLNLDSLNKAKDELAQIESSSRIEICVCNVVKSSDIINLIEFVKKEFSSIDIWINNAGVNQPDKAIWELEESDINLVLDVDLKGAVLGSKLVMEEMVKQHTMGMNI